MRRAKQNDRYSIFFITYGGDDQLFLGPERSAVITSVDDHIADDQGRTGQVQ